VPLQPANSPSRTNSLIKVSINNLVFLLGDLPPLSPPFVKGRGKDYIRETSPLFNSPHATVSKTMAVALSQS